MRFALPLFLSLGTAAAGFWIGRATGPQGTGKSSPDKPAGLIASSASGARKGSAAGPAGDSAEVIQRAAKPGQSNAALTASIRSALGNTLETTRLSRWMKLLEIMRPEDAPAIQRILQSEAKAGRKYGPENTAFWQTWASLDPKGAWGYAQEHADSGGKHGAEALTKAWAMKDAAAASDAVAGVDDSPFAREALAGLMHGLAESDPAAAVKFASTRLPENLVGDGAVHIAGSMIYQMGNKAVQGWFDALPADTGAEFKRETARVLLESLSRSDPGEVEKFAMARLDQPWAALPDEQRFTVAMIARNGGSPLEYVGEVFQKYPGTENPLDFGVMAAAPDAGKAAAWATAHPDHPAAEAILGGAAMVLHDSGKADEANALIDRIRNPELLARLKPKGE